MSVITVLALAADVIGCLAAATVVLVLANPIDEEYRNRWH